MQVSEVRSHQERGEPGWHRTERSYIQRGLLFHCQLCWSQALECHLIFIFYFFYFYFTFILYIFYFFIFIFCFLFFASVLSSDIVSAGFAIMQSIPIHSCLLGMLIVQCFYCRFTMYFVAAIILRWYFETYVRKLFLIDLQSRQTSWLHSPVSLAVLFIY